MKTDDLIRAISASGRPPVSMHHVWLVALGGAVLVVGSIFLVFLGPRPDFEQAMETIRVLFKFAVTAGLFASTIPVLRMLARPGARPPLWPLLAAPALLLIAVGVELVALPTGRWLPSLFGRNALECMTLIPLLGIGPLVAIMAALKVGAPTRPGRAGAVAGIAAGGLAAVFYAANCTDDSPLFVAAWYSLAILLLAGIGALAGRYMLRW